MFVLYIFVIPSILQWRSQGPWVQALLLQKNKEKNEKKKKREKKKRKKKKERQKERGSQKNGEGAKSSAKIDVSAI